MRNLSESAESPVSEISFNKLMSSSADELYGAADFISSRIWRDISIVGKLALPEPYKESMGYCQEDAERQKTQHCG